MSLVFFMKAHSVSHLMSVPHVVGYYKLLLDWQSSSTCLHISVLAVSIDEA